MAEFVLSMAEINVWSIANINVHGMTVINNALSMAEINVLSIEIACYLQL